MSETLRLFIALEIDPGLSQRIFKDFRQLPLIASFKPVTADQMHLTLKFWPHFPIDLLKDLTDIMDQVAEQFSAIDLEFTQPEIFGGQTARALVLSGTDQSELQSLFETLNQELASAKLANLERRKFRPHLTLCRVREKMEDDDREVFMAWKPDYYCSVGELTLLASTLTASGPEHEILYQAQLGL